MKYRELLSLYKEGKLDEEKQKEVEADIEKQDAIGEYLYEEDEIPDLTKLAQDAHNHVQSEDNQEEFTAMVQKSIRNAFIKMGVAVGAAVLVLVLCALFVLPKAVSHFYYNPAEIVARSEDGIRTTNRMSLDLAVYSELFLPCKYRDFVHAEAEGYGRYTISISPGASYDGHFTAVNGQLVRNKLRLYDTDTLGHPASNAFLLPEAESKIISSETGEVVGPAGTQVEAYAGLERLNDRDWHIGYITLSETTDYNEFYQWLSNRDLSYGELWCAVYIDDGSDNGLYENVGFYLNRSGSSMDWDQEKYPQLSLFDSQGITYKFDDASSVKTHFISMLTYIRDNNEIVDLMNNPSRNYYNYDKMIHYIEENGLKIYGFAIGTQKDTLIELSKDDKVNYIYTKPFK